MGLLYTIPLLNLSSLHIEIEIICIHVCNAEICFTVFLLSWYIQTLMNVLTNATVTAAILRAVYATTLTGATSVSVHLATLTATALTSAYVS